MTGMVTRENQSSQRKTCPSSTFYITCLQGKKLVTAWLTAQFFCHSLVDCLSKLRTDSTCFKIYKNILDDWQSQVLLVVSDEFGKGKCVHFLFSCYLLTLFWLQRIMQQWSDDHEWFIGKGLGGSMAYFVDKESYRTVCCPAKIHTRKVYSVSGVLHNGLKIQTKYGNLWVL
jgi:hypothetical protein